MTEDSKPKKRIVIVVSGLTSHVFSALGVARRVPAEDFLVEFWGEESCRRLVRRQRFPFFALAGLRYCYDRVLFNRWRDVIRRPAILGQIAANAKARKKALHADLALTDQSIRSQLARGTVALVILEPLLAHYYPLFASLGVRCVMLQDKPIPEPDPLVPPPTFSWRPGHGALGRACVQLLWASQRLDCLLRRTVKVGAGALGLYTPDQLVNAIGRRVPSSSAFTVRRRVPYDLHYRGLEEWVIGAPNLDFPRRRSLPANVRYLGPCVDLQRVETPLCITRSPMARFLIYASMGVSMGHWQTDIAILRRIVRAFGGLSDVQLVMATGSMQARAALDGTFPNVHVFSTLPQLEILKLADLAIIHGGANGFRECIVTGTPMLAFPREYDQNGNAARIAYYGLGLRGSRRRDTPAAIRRKAMRVLEDESFLIRVREIRQIALSAEEKLFAAAIDSLTPSAASIAF